MYCIAMADVHAVSILNPFSFLLSNNYVVWVEHICLRVTVAVMKQHKSQSNWRRKRFLWLTQPESLTLREAKAGELKLGQSWEAGADSRGHGGVLLMGLSLTASSAG